MLTLTRDDLGDAIVELNQSFFVNPIGVIEQINTTGSEFDNLISNGVQTYAHDVSGDCHHKYAIVDHSEVGSDPLVITGSHNWSSSAENVNDENTVIVHDAPLQTCTTKSSEASSMLSQAQMPSVSMDSPIGRSCPILPAVRCGFVV